MKYGGYSGLWVVYTCTAIKQERNQTASDCFLHAATCSSQFDWDHLYYAKDITVSYCIQRSPDLAITFNCHIMLLPPYFIVDFS